MKARWQGFGERIKRLNPIWHVASGMQLAGLKEHAQMVALGVMLEVFYREVANNTDRKKQDLHLITHNCIEELGLHELVEEEQNKWVERFVDGLLWSGQAELQQPFTANWFDEKDQRMKLQRFRYFVEDRAASQWERGGKTVYQCSDEVKELIFISREILQELEITIDQLYIEHLLKNGQYQQALSGMDDLIARVKRMIARELDFRESMKRNPKVIFQQEQDLRSHREQELKQQFQEEKHRFQQMKSLLNRIGNSTQLYEISEKLELTRRYHDQLAGQVIENMRLEIELRYEYPHLFWKQQQVSFQQSYFQEWIVSDGLPEPEAMSVLLAPLFSPGPHFIYPLDWSWMEQESESNKNEQQEAKEPMEENTYHLGRVVDWERIARLWEPLFVHLLERGYCSLSDLRDIPESLQERWLEQKEAIDLWLLFHSEPLTIQSIDDDKEQTDERMRLIQELFKRQQGFSDLIGRRIVSTIAMDEPMIRWKGVYISPFRLQLTTERSR